jgi:Uma2 family endonuclease
MITADLAAETVFDCDFRVTRLGPESAGLSLSREEFLAIDDYDELFRYELIHGIVVVSPYPGPGERGPNGRLDQWLWNYHDNHPQGKSLDDTLQEQAIDTGACIRRVDRVIWVGLGRQPVPMQDVPAIVIELVSNTRRDRKRDYEEKRAEYAAIGVREYWVIDRFHRTLTICRGDEVTRVVKENETYETPLLPGFQLPLGELLKVADRWSGGGA